MQPLPYAEFNRALAPFPHPLVFVTLSGSHLYGFPSADSDYDLRGSHLLPGEAFWSLREPVETLELELESEAGLVEIVSHDLRKFTRMLLKRNGYVLEQLTSPLVVRTSPVHGELKRLVPGLLTRHHYHHYRGFYHGERREYERSEPKSVKRLLYCYRVLMTGCVLLREGIVEANLVELNRRWGFGFLDELIEIKWAAEWGGVPAGADYTGELERLEAELDRAFVETRLPEAPDGWDELDRLVVRARREGEATG